MGRSRSSLAVAALLAAVAAAPAAAQGPAITEVVGGLDSPRGVAIGADGTIYVGEAGEGGTAPCIDSPELGKVCFGMTGGISAVKDGVATRIVDGLPSGITETGETLGVSDVAVGPDGTVWFLVGGPGPGAAEGRGMVPDGAGAALGQLYQVGAHGAAVSVAGPGRLRVREQPRRWPAWQRGARLQRQRPGCRPGGRARGRRGRERPAHGRRRRRHHHRGRLVVAGAPVIAFSLARQGSRAQIAGDTKAPTSPDVSHPLLREWLDALPASRGWGAAFETRIWWTPRGATGTVESKLRQAGYLKLAKGERFIVAGAYGPLRDGELERARAWGADLAQELATRGLAGR